MTMRIIDLLLNPAVLCQWKILPIMMLILFGKIEEGIGDNEAYEKPPPEVLEETLKLFEEASAYADFIDVPENVILALGNMGTGKTTLLKLLVDDKALVSEESLDGYIIKEINSEGIVSSIEQTVSYPIFTTNKDTGMVFCDSPEFGGLHSVSENIAVSFAFHKITEKLSKVKVIIAIDYSSFVPNCYSTDFLDLLKNIRNFFLDFTRFKTGMMLVITNVWNDYDEKTQEISPSDEIIVDSIKSCLQNGLLGFPNNNQSGQPLQEIIEILIKNVCLLRESDDIGPVSEIEVLQSSRNNILSSLEKLEYIELLETDFGYFISDLSNSSIRFFLEELGTNVQSSVLSVFKSWKKQLMELISVNKDVLTAFQVFKHNSKALAPLVKYDTNSIEITNEFTTLFVKAIEKSRGVYFKASESVDVALFSNYLYLFETISKRTSSRLILRGNELNQLLAFTGKYYLWYGYLKTIFDYLTSFEGSRAHKNVLFNVPELQNASKENFSQMFDILAKGTANRFSNYLSLQKEKLTETQFAEFMEIFMISQAKCLVSDNTAFIDGSIVVLQDDLNLCSLNYQKLSVSATIKAYLFDLVKLNGIIDISIVSPKVEVVGLTVLTADGLDGVMKKPVVVGHGINGQQGGSGGNIVILTRYLKGQSQFKVSSAGGNGAAGQNAGKVTYKVYHKDSNTNIDCPLNSTYIIYAYSSPAICTSKELSDSERIVCGENCGNYCNYKVERHEGWKCTLLTFIIFMHECFGFSYHCCLKKYGNKYSCKTENRDYNMANELKCSLKGERAQTSEIMKDCSALNGGDGGNGGAPGSVKILSFDSSYNASVEINQLFGAPGLGGEGKNFSQNYAAYLNSYFGKQGQTGLVKKEFFNPRLSLSNDLYTFLNFSINYFSQYNSDSLQNFYTELNSNLAMVQMSGTYNLARETLLLFRFFDKQHDANKKNLAVPFYRSLSQKILSYSKVMLYNHSSELFCPNNDLNCTTTFSYVLNESFSGHRSVLALLYTSVLAKISSQERPKDFDLIIDNAEFLSQTKTTLGVFLKETWEVEIAESINKSTQNYNKKIENKISESLSYIEKELQPEVKKLGRNLEGEIKILVESINDKIKDTSNTRKNIRKTQEELQKAMNYEMAFGALKMFGSLASMLGPYGQTVGSIVETGSNIALSVGPKSEDSLKELQKLQSHVQNGLGQLTNWQDSQNRERMIAFDEELTIIIDKAMKLSDKLSHFKKKIDQYINLYKDIRYKSPINHAGLRQLRSKIVDAIESAALESNVTKGRDIEIPEREENDTALLTGLKISAGLLKIAEAGVNLYNNFKKGEEGLQLGDKLIQMADEKIRMYVEFKSQVDSFITPMIQDMTKALSAYNGSKITESLTSLDVSSWKIRSKIGEMRHQVIKFTNAIDSNLANEIDQIAKQMDDAMGTIMVVYQRIEQFNQDMQLVEHMGYLASPKVETPVDASTQNLANSIKKHVKSANAIWFYNKAIQSVKFYVFPFANPYFQGFDITTKFFKIESDTNGYIEEALGHVSKILETLSQKDSIVNTEVDDYFEKVYFKLNDPATTSVAFYRWNSESSSNQIDRLLVGERVYLNSDIFESPMGLDVIKFRTAHLEFRARDKTTNNELRTALEKYRIRQRHTGSNFFRCGKNFYVLESIPLNISYSYSFKDEQEKIPDQVSDAYEKLANGDYLLSPYTNWAFQLRSSPNANFSDLKLFQGEVIDLFLNGHGTFIEDFDFESFSINDYYEPDVSLNQIYKEKEKTIVKSAINEKHSFKVVKKLGRTVVI